jgi:hypothetical protein
MSLTPEEVEQIRVNYLNKIAPEFNLSDTNQIEIISFYLSNASDDISNTYFGDKTNRAIALLAAHNLTLIDPLNIVQDNKQDVGGIAKVKKKRDRVEIETSYNSLNNGVNKAFEDVYATTNYGIQFIQLRRSCKKTRVLVV